MNQSSDASEASEVSDASEVLSDISCVQSASAVFRTGSALWLMYGSPAVASNMINVIRLSYLEA